MTDYAFGSKSKALYSTAQIFFAGVIDGRDVLFLHGNSDQAHEIALFLTGTPSKFQTSQFVAVSQGSTNTMPHEISIVSFSPGIDNLVTIWDSDTQLVLFSDSDTAATFWSPTISGKSTDPFRNFWSIGTNETILVGGPYLVRDATVSGSKLALRGDLQDDIQLTVIAPRSVRSITWNGRNVPIDTKASSAVTSRGGFIGQLKLVSSLANVKAPKLSGWKYQDSLPEIQHGFDDSSWTIANHTTTNIPYPPYFNDGRILYGCDYGL